MEVSQYWIIPSNVGPGFLRPNDDGHFRGSGDEADVILGRKSAKQAKPGVRLLRIDIWQWPSILRGSIGDRYPVRSGPFGFSS